MNKYNNKFNRTPQGDNSMRFINRPRYGANNSPRFSQQQNQLPYNYPTNRNNMSPGSYQMNNNNQYEQNARNYYGHGTSKPTTPKHQQQKIKSSTYTSYTHTPPKSAAISSSPKTNLNSGKKSNQSTPKSVAPVKPTTQNVTETLPDNPFAYNNYFYPNYNTDINASPTTYGMNESINPYMWHAITSMPPPNMMQQQQQPPLPPPQTLAQQQKPPLPGADALPPLHPPPPIPTFLGASSPAPTTDERVDGGNAKASGPLVKIKSKRKAMSTRYNLSKTWCEEDALLALKAEKDYMSKQQKDVILVLRFPDPEISRDIVKSYHSAIESVHFQLNFAPRYCFAHFKPDIDVDKVIEDLSKVPFGNGFITAEVKSIPSNENPTKTTEIDPYTLYCGNLPTTMACKVLKEHFPGAARIDIGFAQRMKYTRYAFIRYQKVEDAIDAYKRMLDAEIGGRSLILRFRRIASSKDEELIADDLNVLNETSLNAENNDLPPGSSQNVIQTEAIAPRDTVKPTNASDLVKETLNETQSTNLDTVTASATSLEEDHTESRSKVAVDSTKTAKESDKHPNNESNQSNKSITKDSNTAAEKKRMSSLSSDITQVSSDSSLPISVHNIKPDPEIDPEDRVIRDETNVSRSDYYKDNIKQEEELDADFEFLAPVNDEERSDNTADNISLSTDATNETLISGSSLGEFLRTCQREAETATGCTIKREPIENTSTKTSEELINPQEECTTIKQENSNSLTTDYDISNGDNTSNAKLIKTIRKRRETIGEGLKAANKDCDMATKRPKLSTAGKPQSLAKVMDISNTSQPEPIDNDDIVPPSSLLGKRDQNFSKEFNDKSNKINNYEFYDKTNKPLEEDLIKQEPWDMLLNNNSEENKTVSPQKVNATETLETTKIWQNSTASLQKVNKTETTKIPQSKPNNSLEISLNKETSAFNNCPEDDDLVPLTNNLLDSRQSAKIKQEQNEHEDMFAEPIEDTNVNYSKDKDLKDLTQHAGSSLTVNLKISQVSAKDKTSAKDNIEQSSKDSKNVNSNCSEKSNDSEDDIIVVSEYFPPKRTSTECLPDSRSHIYGGELVTFEPEPLPTTENPNFISSFNILGDRYSHFSERYKLDRIYDELEADFDDES